MISRVAFALFLLLPPAAMAQECPSGKSHDEARAVVADLERIVTPNGVEEAYDALIGGIPQAISVRGEDRDNPMILSVHGGPASPAMPSHWQFQRPMEEYFTVAHWDQRGAGRTFLKSDPKSIADGLQRT